MTAADSSRLIRENAALKAQVAALGAQLTDLRKSLDAAVASGRRLEGANKQLAATIRELSKEIAGLRGQLESSLGLSPLGPDTPSGQRPRFLPPAAKKTRGRKPGAKVGHRGASRPRPEPDREERHTLDACPHCAGPVRAVRGHDCKPIVRFRYVEDVVRTAPECVAHAIGQYWCRDCKRRVEPAVTAALPGARLGLRAVVQAARQHFQMGIPTTKVVRILREDHGFTVTAGGLCAAWNLAAALLQVDYDEIRKSALAAGVLHADETGWRVNGERHWLWCFCTAREALYVIDSARSGAVARAVLGEGFNGVLVRDFYVAYERCTAAENQYCLAHLLREFERVAFRRGQELSDEFRRFQAAVVGVVRAAIRWDKKAPPDPRVREAARLRFERRLLPILEEPRRDRDAVRLTNRLLRSADGIFTFVSNPAVPPTNNRAEREIRPAVVARKNSGGNRSASGAQTQAVLMSICRTLELRGENVEEALMARLQACIIENHRLKHAPLSVIASEG